MNAAAFPSPHLYTLTGNLLAERTLEFDHWSPGRTQRAKRETFQVGGKGFNVSQDAHAPRHPSSRFRPPAQRTSCWPACCTRSSSPESR